MKFQAEITAAGKIVPLYDSDYDAFRKLKRNVPLTFEVKQERNAKFHRKFHALVSMVYENQEIYTDRETLRYDLTIEAGYWNEHVTFDGEIKRTAKSISFASMDDTEFSELYNAFIAAVIRVMGWDNEMIDNNLESYL
jgi:hypothetical protein